MNKLYYDPYSLRYVSREHWEYSFSNEIIYAPQSSDINGFGNIISPESYVNGWLWVEIIILDRNDDIYNVIIESFDTFFDSRRDDNAHFSGASDKSPVLVSDVQLVQLPESLRFGGETRARTLLSVIRLKKLDSLFKLVGKMPDFIIETILSPLTWPFLPIGPLGEDGEFDAAQISSSFMLTEPTNQPIETGTHIVSSESSEDAEIERESNTKELSPQDLVSLFSIYLTCEYQGIGLKEGADSVIKGLKMFFRPTEFQTWSIEDMHELYYAYERQKGQQTEDPKGSRNTDTDEGRLLRQPEEGGEARPQEGIRNLPPEGGQSQIERGHRLGGNTAKHTHSGNLEDV